MTGQSGFRRGSERKKPPSKPSLGTTFNTAPKVALEDGLESVKKAHQVAGIGTGRHPAAAPFSTATRPRPVTVQPDLV
jgi:hypothetical protein